MGIISAVKFSYQTNIISKKQLLKIINHIESLNLKIKINKFFKKKDIKKIVNFMKLDKKNRSSKINLILLKKIGSPIIDLKFNQKNISSFLKNELEN